MQKLNLMCPINSLGYGYTGLNILKSLHKQGVTVSLFPIGQPQLTTQEDVEIVQKCIDNAKFFSIKDPCIKIWHQNDMAQFAGRGEHIGFPIFELDEFTKLELHHLNSCDRLFVCSEWAKGIVQKNLSEYSKNYYQIDVVPLGVDTSIFKPQLSEQTDTIFFNCGKWEVRKGHDVLVKLFTETFSPTDDVQLWMMCENPFCTPEERERWENLYKHTEHYKNNKIKLIPRVPTHQEVYNIMKQVDCGVFLSRAEGWNLEALEILSCGKRLIITDYSAHTEFCTHQNSYLLPIEETELAFDNKWFFGQGSWAKLDQHHFNLAKQHMREVHHDKKNKNLKLNSEGIETGKKFTWENSIRNILNVI